MFRILSSLVSELGHVQYERLVSDALENLTDYFESFDELENCPEDYDVQYAVSFIGST